MGAGDDPPGEPAAQFGLSGLDVTVLIRALGGALRRFHATPPQECPFDGGPDALLAEAARRVASGAAEVDRFDPPFRRYSPDHLLDLARRGRPADLPPEALVVVHGSARLTAVRFEGEQVSGWTDLDRSGLGDAYRDLATLTIDLAASVSPEALGPFVDVYGLDQVDVARLDWHVLVDQLLR